MTELATFTQEHTVADVRFMDEVTPDLFGAMQQNSFLGKLPEDELSGLLNGCVVKEIGTNECLTRQGEPVDFVYFIWICVLHLERTCQGDPERFVSHG